MTIQYAILGLLSWKPLSGYDLKKIVSDSELFYWAGTNNQIYRTLMQLLQDGLVSQEIQPQESLPARKVYSITAQGSDALKAWVQSEPDTPELHNTFLIQLAWADCLTSAELDAVAARYEGEINLQLKMAQEKARRNQNSPQRSERERFLWQKIHENRITWLQTELIWVRGLRRGLKAFGDEV